MKRWTHWLWVALTLYFALPAWARLGGGSSYRSSSRSSSSSRSYSSGRSSWGSSSSSRSSGSSWGWGSSSSSSSRGYSSGGSYYSSGGGGDFGDFLVGLFIFFLIVCVFMYFGYKALRGGMKTSKRQAGSFLGVSTFIWVIIGLFWPPLLGILALAYIMGYGRASDSSSVSLESFLSQESSRYSEPFGSQSGYVPQSPNLRQPRRAPYEELLNSDPNFSVPVFREFAVLVYCQALQEMASGNFVHARPFLSKNALSQLTQRGASLDEVRDVVVGMFEIKKANNGYSKSFITVGFESNYIVVQGGRTRAYVAQETWTFDRKPGVLTRPPKAVSKLTCPSCGYGGEFPSNGVCPQCGTTNVNGDFDWVVRNISVSLLEEFAPHAAEGGGVEEGTNLPTVKHWELGRRKEEFMASHPDFSWNDFWDKASRIFMKLQQGWTRRDPSMCRPHETDVLYRMHRYWIEDYKRNNKINELSNIQIDKWELSNITIDAFYESITGRVHASMIDVTKDESGRVLYGDASRPRRFTEYWTFIRRIGHQEAKGDSTVQCPSCGAPLDNINQAGECEYCNTVVTLGDFDWVLTNIEQDEVYQPL